MSVEMNDTFLMQWKFKYGLFQLPKILHLSGNPREPGNIFSADHEWKHRQTCVRKVGKEAKEENQAGLTVCQQDKKMWNLGSRSVKRLNKLLVINRTVKP